MTYVPEYKFEMFTVNPNPDTVNLLASLEAWKYCMSIDLV